MSDEILNHIDCNFDRSYVVDLFLKEGRYSTLQSAKVHANEIKRKAIELNLNIIEPMFFKDYFSNDFKIWSEVGFRRGQFEIVVDELESCLEDFFKEEISVATGTIPTIHPQTLSVSQKFKDYKWYMSDKEYKKGVLGEWNL